jgi:hypothetical protein
MSRSLVRRLIAVLALSALLGSPATSLAGPRPAARHSRTQAAAQAPLSWLWNALVSVWEKEGCHIDPYGRCTTITPQETADAGCSADPYGHCLPGQ